MSKQDKNKIEFATTTDKTNFSNDNEDKAYDQRTAFQNNINNKNQQQSFNSNHDSEQSNRSINEALEESKRSIEKNTDEARNQIPRYAQVITDTQEQTAQATKEIAENYLEYQKQAINSFQSVLMPYFENVHNQLWNNQEFFRRIPEMYSRMISTYTENAISFSRIFNDVAFSNMGFFKNTINEAKEQSKHLTAIGKRNIRVYEGIGKDNRDVSISQSSSINQNRK